MKNNIKDALIGETTIKNNLILITNDNSLRNIINKLDGISISYNELMIIEAIKKFIKKDKRDLLSIKVYEPTISHRIAVYLESKFKNYDIDCEYNKNNTQDKKININKKIRPDIIVHKRKQNKNLIVIEIKKAGIKSKKGKNDITKLENMCDQLNYNVGVFIGVLKKKIDLCFIYRDKINKKIYIDNNGKIHNRK